MTKTYDIVVWGASGYTGGLVAKYLSSYNIAIAGRSEQKLVALSKKLNRPYLVGNLDNLTSITSQLMMCPLEGL